MIADYKNNAAVINVNVGADYVWTLVQVSAISKSQLNCLSNTLWIQADPY